MKTLASKSQLQLLRRIISGEFNHNELRNQWGFSIVMICNNHGYYGDLTLHFYQDGNHVLTYEAQLAYGKAKAGVYENQATEVRFEKIVAQVKNALEQCEYTIVPAQWKVVDESNADILIETENEESAREEYVRFDMDKRGVSLSWRPAGFREESDWEQLEWNCDLDTGEYDSGNE